ncbi:MAG: hypothetical protein IKM97_01650 [Clostridia bacterium]|nr:hypothetical protein [Clostridia bacterium]
MKRKNIIKQLEKNLEIITSLEELNEKQKNIRQRMLKIFANNDDFEYEKLNKKYLDKSTLNSLILSYFYIIISLLNLSRRVI